MNFQEKLEQYAKICVEVGVVLKEGQDLFITAPVESYEFTRMVVKEAYAHGAKTVTINWNDEISGLYRMSMAPDSSFEVFPEWEVLRRTSLLDNGAAFMSIVAPDPDLLKDCDPTRVAKWTKVSRVAMESVQKRLMNNESQWLVAAVPSNALALKAFPNDTKEVAFQKYWDAILSAVRIDGNDPVENWNNHIEAVRSKVSWLNECHFKSLHYTNSDKSTDLTINLPEGHVWQGAGDTTLSGHDFRPNLPTEEVFTMPHKDGSNGVIKSTKPFNYNGNCIENFTLTFKDGVIVDFTAEKGYDTLKELLSVDDGAKRIGEVALVPVDSPISNSGITFYTTLFDENASCHLAFGRAYPTNLKGGSHMTDAELKAGGANTSLVHEDFMVGSEDLQIVGTTYDGKEIPVFINGNWA